MANLLLASIFLIGILLAKGSPIPFPPGIVRGDNIFQSRGILLFCGGTAPVPAPTPTPPPPGNPMITPSPGTPIISPSPVNPLPNDPVNPLPNDPVINPPPTNLILHPPPMDPTTTPPPSNGNGNTNTNSDGADEAKTNFSDEPPYRRWCRMRNGEEE